MSVYRARLAKGYTQAELAQRAGISLQTVFAIENGYRHPSFVLLKKLAQALDVPMESLIPAAQPPEKED